MYDFSSTETFKAFFDDKLRGRSFHFSPSLTPCRHSDLPAVVLLGPDPPHPRPCSPTVLTPWNRLPCVIYSLDMSFSICECSMYASCMCVGACGQGTHSHMCLCMSGIILNGISTLLTEAGSLSQSQSSAIWLFSLASLLWKFLTSAL